MSHLLPGCLCLLPFMAPWPPTLLFRPGRAVTSHRYCGNRFQRRLDGPRRWVCFPSPLQTLVRRRLFVLYISDENCANLTMGCRWSSLSRLALFHLFLFRAAGVLGYVILDHCPFTARYYLEDLKNRTWQVYFGLSVWLHWFFIALVVICACPVNIKSVFCLVML